MKVSYKQSSPIPLVFYFKKRFYLSIFRERGKEGKRERNTQVWQIHHGLVASCTCQVGTPPATQASALTGNSTGDRPLCGALWDSFNQLSHMGQGLTPLFYMRSSNEEKWCVQEHILKVNCKASQSFPVSWLSCSFCALWFYSKKKMVQDHKNNHRGNIQATAKQIRLIFHIWTYFLYPKIVDSFYILQRRETLESLYTFIISFGIQYILMKRITLFNN